MRKSKIKIDTQIDRIVTLGTDFSFKHICQERKKLHT